MLVLLISTFLLSVAPPVETPVSGQVFDAAGAPANEATVRCRAVEEYETVARGAKAESAEKAWKPRAGSETAVQLTGEDGRFAIACGEGDTFRLRVEHDGHAPHVEQEVAANATLNVRLVRGEQLAGRIVDLGTSSPIAGATARLCDDASGVFDRDACAQATTDEAGTFRLVDLPRGQHRVSFHEASHEKRTIEDVEVPRPVAPDSGKTQPLLVFLGPGGTLRGTLVTHSGQASAEALLQAVPQETRLIVGARDENVRSDHTEEDGTFEFEGLQAGVKYQLRANVEGFAPLSEGPFTLERGEVVEDLRLVLTRGATLRFRLVDEDGEPVTAERLATRGEPGKERAARHFDGKRLEIGEDGQHTVRAVPSEATSLTIYTDCCADFEKEGVVLTGNEPVDLGTLVLDRGSAISGTVRDSTGAAVAEASVSVSWRDGKRYLSKKAETDEAGNYRAAGLDEEALTTVSVSKAGFAESEREEIAAGSSEIDFVLARTGTVSGTVLLPDGSPATSFEIESHRTDGAERRGFAFGMSRPSRRFFKGLDGKFSVDGLDPGTYTLVARAKGMAPARRADLAVASDAVASAGTLTLGRGVTVTGRVVTSDGEVPVPGAAVRAGKPEMFRFAASEPAGDVSAIADLEGRFVLEGLEPGAVVVDAVHSDHSPVEQRLELNEGDDPPPLLLKLGAGGRLTGTVRDAEGQVVPAAEIVVHKGLMGAEPLRAVTDENGRYVFEKLATGSYTAMLMQHKTTNRLAGMDMKSVLVEEGETATLDFDADAAIRLTGRVLRGGAPVADVTLMFLSGNHLTGQPRMRSTSTDAMGRYSVGLDHGGTYQVSIFGGEPPRPGTIKLEVPDEPEVARDLELEDGSILEGSVVDDEGRPVGRAAIAASPANLEGRAAMEQIRQAFSESDGRYVIRGLEPGTYRLSAVATGHAPAEQTVTVSDEGPTTADFELDRGSTLRGRVVDPQDRPIAQAVIVATPSGSTAGFQSSSNGMSALDGSFEITVPSGTSVDLTALSIAWAPTTLRGIVAGEDGSAEETLIRLSSGGRLLVTVTTTEGRPASGVTLTLEDLEAGAAPMNGLIMLQQLARQPTNGEGTAVLSLLAPGTYRLSAAGRSVVETVDVEIHEGVESVARLTVTD